MKTPRKKKCSCQRRIRLDLIDCNFFYADFITQVKKVLHIKGLRNCYNFLQKKEQTHKYCCMVV